MSYYICRRTFRDRHGLVSAGSIIDPADIKRLKFRLHEKTIIEVNEHSFERLSNFFKVRYGIEIPSLTANEGDPEPKDVPKPKAASAQLDAKAETVPKPTQKVKVVASTVIKAKVT